MPEPTDHYPSRNGSRPGILPRLEPVLHGATAGLDSVLREQLGAYEKQGFVVVPNLFGEAEVDRLLQELQRLRTDDSLRHSESVITEPGSDEVRSVFRIQDHCAAFAKLAADPRLLDVVRAILADDVYLHQTRANYKPGFRGREFYWHSDFETWHVEDGMPGMRAVSVAIALTENLSCNGPLMLVPGSHRHYVQCPGTTPENHYRQSLQRQEYGVPQDQHLNILCREGPIQSCLGGPGAAVFFDCNTMHGSGSNISPFPRSNLFLVYNALSNRLLQPFSGQAPRPEHIAARERVQMVS